MSVNRTQSPISLEMWQTAYKDFVITVLDDDANPVDISEMTLRFVVHDADGTGKFDVEDGSITKGGDDDNEATVAVTPTESADVSDNWHWELWDVTTENEEEVLAHGPIKIKVAVKNVG